MRAPSDKTIWKIGFAGLLTTAFCYGWIKEAINNK